MVQADDHSIVLSLDNQHDSELSKIAGGRFLKTRASRLDTVSTGSDSDLVSDQHGVPIVHQVAIAPCTDCFQELSLTLRQNSQVQRVLGFA